MIYFSVDAFRVECDYFSRHSRCNVVFERELPENISGATAEIAVFTALLKDGWIIKNGKHYCCKEHA